LLALLGGATIVVVSRLRVNYQEVHTQLHITIKGYDYINYSNLCRGKRCLGGHDRLCTLCQVWKGVIHHSPATTEPRGTTGQVQP